MSLLVAGGAVEACSFHHPALFIFYLFHISRLPLLAPRFISRLYTSRLAASYLTSSDIVSQVSDDQYF